MQVGDLVKHIPSNSFGLIIKQDDWHQTLVKWLDEIGEVEDVHIYEGELEVASASIPKNKKQKVLDKRTNI